MGTSQTFLEQTYRRIVWSIALGTLIISVAVFVVTLLASLFSQSVFTVVILTITLITGIGCAIALLVLVRQQPLWQAIVSFGTMIIACEVAIAIWLPELRLATIPFLAVVILLAGLQGQRSFSIGATVLCVLVAIPLVVLNQSATDTQIAPLLLTFLKTSSIVALFVAIWAFLDRTMAAQMQALQIADQRADEAEAARQATEVARREIEQRALEQQRLLELIDVLELPVLTIEDRVLLAPLVGRLDSRRTEALRGRLLEMVASRRAHTVIIDVTGISFIDTAVAKALIDTATAIRLLGARTIVSGIGPSVAQTLVHLNVGLAEIATAPNPEAALRLAHAVAVNGK